MFFNKRRPRKEAEDLLKLLHHAWHEVHPDRFLTSEDETLFNGPRLTTFNSFIGGSDKDRFATIALKDIYEAVARYEKSGLADEVMTMFISTGDIVSGALVSTCRREYALNKRGNDQPTESDDAIIEIAQKIVACLNRSASHIRR